MKSTDRLTALAGVLAAAVLAFSPMDCRAAGGAADCTGTRGAPGAAQECPVPRPAAAQDGAGAGAGPAAGGGAADPATSQGEHASAQDAALLEDLIDNDADRSEADVEP